MASQIAVQYGLRFTAEHAECCVQGQVGEKDVHEKHAHRTRVQQEMHDDARENAMCLTIEVTQTQGEKEQRNPVRSM